MANWIDWKKMKGIAQKAEQAKSLFLQNRTAGEQEFITLLNSNPNDGMVHLKLGEAYEAVQEYALASKHFHLAKSFFPMPEYQGKAQNGIERVDHHLQSSTLDDPFERIKSTLPPDVRDAVQDAEKCLEQGEYQKVSIAIGQTGVRSLIKYLELTSGDDGPQGPPQGLNWEQRTRNLEGRQIIDPIAANQLKMVRDIRNNSEYKTVSLSLPDAKNCIDVFKSALVRIFQGKTTS